MPASFQAFYATELQGAWLQLPVPALFLAWLVLAGRARAERAGGPDASFVVAYWSQLVYGRFPNAHR